MGIVFLPIVFTNIPSPFNSPFIYLVIWAILLGLFHVDIYLSYSIIPIYLFIFIYFLAIPIFWSNVTVGFNYQIGYVWLLKEISWTLLAILMTTYFIKSRDYYGFGVVSIVAIIFIIITSITSIYGFTLFPSATRQMASGSAAYEGLETLFRNMGIGTFGFFSGVAFLVPIFVYYLKNKGLDSRLRLYLFGFTLIILYSIYMSVLTTSLFTALGLFIIGMSIKGVNFTRQVVFPSMIIIITFIVFSYQIGQLMYLFENIFENTSYEFKFNELGRAFEKSDFNPNSSQNYIAKERLSRSFYSLMSFSENPIIGGGKSMGHAHWLDRLGLFGLLGFLPWVYIFVTQIKQNVKLFTGNYRIYYYLSFMSFIFFGLFKGGLESVEVSICIFFLAPGLYFIKYVID